MAENSLSSFYDPKQTYTDLHSVTLEGPMAGNSLSPFYNPKLDLPVLLNLLDLLDLLHLPYLLDLLIVEYHAH